MKRNEYNNIDLPNEIWKDVVGYDGLYMISNMGRLRSLPRLTMACSGGWFYTKDILISQATSKGYKLAALQIDGNRQTKSVHIMVGESFVPNPENKPYINHKNGVKSCNIYNNLEWSTQAENVRHAFKNGLVGARNGEKSPVSKLKEENILEIRKREYDNNELAMKFNVTPQCINAVLKHKTWTHI